MKEKILEYVSKWENRCYSEGIPDEAPKELEVRGIVPSYRLIAIAILKNDISLKMLGFTPKYSEYYSYYKNIEIQKRNGILQLKLDL